MKTRTAFQLVAICLLTSCASAHNVPSEPVTVGGYADIEVNDEIKSAALFAVQTQAKRENKPLKLVEISKAKQQVVAGMNYQFELTVKSGETPRHATAVVFRSLQSSYELTSWQWL
jgi:hypothetical protein